MLNELLNSKFHFFQKSSRQQKSMLVLNSIITLRFMTNKFLISIVVRFPALSQIIFGGHPKKADKSLKSESWVTIRQLLCLAKSHITLSGELIRFSFLTVEDVSNS